MKNLVAVIFAVVAFLAPVLVGAQTLDKNSVRMPNGDIVFPKTGDTLKFHPFQPLTKEDSLKKALSAMSKKLNAQGKQLKAQGERIAMLEKRADNTDYGFRVVDTVIRNNESENTKKFVFLNYKIDTTARASWVRDSVLKAEKDTLAARFVRSEIEWANKVSVNEARRDSSDSVLLSDINIIDFEGKKLRPSVIKAKRARCNAEKRLQAYEDSVRNATPVQQTNTPTRKKGCNCKGTSSSDIFSIPTFDSPIDQGWRKHLLRKYYFEEMRKLNQDSRSSAYISNNHYNSDMT